MEYQDLFRDDFLPVVRALGYDVTEGHSFELAEKAVIKPGEKIKIDQVLLSAGYNLKTSYIEDTYSVELDEDNPKSERSPLPAEALSFFD